MNPTKERGVGVSKHTSGPWVVSEGVTHVTVRGDNGEVIFHDDKRIDRVREDAHLISAAPELLEALIGFMNEFGDKSINNKNVCKARAAIAKAKGEEK